MIGGCFSLVANSRRYSLESQMGVDVQDERRNLVLLRVVVEEKITCCQYYFLAIFRSTFFETIGLQETLKELNILKFLFSGFFHESREGFESISSWFQHLQLLYNPDK